MTGYIRNDTTNNIANGNVINASDLDGEFDAVQSAFDASTGHNHDGTVGGGAPIAALGPAQDVVITTSVMRPKTDNTVDLGTSTLEFKDLYLDGTAKVDTLTVDESATIAADLTVNGNTTLGNAATDTVTVTADVASHLIPATDNTYDLGGASDEWRNLYIDGTAQVDTLQVDESATITADLTVNGNTTLGNATTDTLTLTAQLATSVLPSTDDAVDLGSSSKEWRDLYVDGTANIDTLVADTATISAGTATLSAGTIITSTGGTLTLQRNDTAITTGETLGEIDFQAPNVSGGGDAIVVAATIRAVARDTFDAAVNKTSLLFETADSGVVATRMEIDGTGNVAVDTNTLYVDAVNNRVGVGTITPVEKLEVVQGLARFANDITPATEGDGAAYFGKIGGQAFVSNTGGFAVRDSGTTRLTVDTSGNVGIGTASPTGLLTIGSSTPRLDFLETGGSAGFDNTTLFRDADIFGIQTRNGGTFVSNDYRISTNASGALTHEWRIGNTERMRIDSSGNVGIGTASPSAKLDVSGTSGSIVAELQVGANDDVALNFRNAAGTQVGYITSHVDSITLDGDFTKFSTGGTERMRIDSSGNVGIGTSNPTQKLHLEQNTAATPIQLRVENDSATSGAEAQIALVTSGNNFSLVTYPDADTPNANRTDFGSTAGSSYFTFSPNGTERMMITSSGNVGIGMTPTGTLSIRPSGTGSEDSHIGYGANLDTYITTGSDGVVIFREGNGAGINTERMRINSSGTVLVGKTSDDNGATAGIQLAGTGVAHFTRNSTVAAFNRLSTDGVIVTFRKDGTTLGDISASTGVLLIEGVTETGPQLRIGSSSTSVLTLGAYASASSYGYIGDTSGGAVGIAFVNVGVVPVVSDTGTASDNTFDIGALAVRWDDIYATNGTIQTSDRNEKQDIEELSEAERRVAVACKGLMRKYRWKDAVAEKGDEARIHFGIIAQDLQAAFAAEGLDAGRYAMFISSTWWEMDEVVPATETEPERTVKKIYDTAEEAPEGATERTRLGVRYPELLAFIIAAL